MLVLFLAIGWSIVGLLPFQSVRSMLLSILIVEILEQRDVPCEYTADAESMLRMRFECLFFLARKKVVAVEVGEEAVAAPAAAAIT